MLLHTNSTTPQAIILFFSHFIRKLLLNAGKTTSVFPIRMYFFQIIFLIFLRNKGWVIFPRAYCINLINQPIRYFRKPQAASHRRSNRPYNQFILTNSDWVILQNFCQSLCTSNIHIFANCFFVTFINKLATILNINLLS